MDNQLIWKEEFNIGVDVIDKEHQKLFRTIRELFSLRGSEQSLVACREKIWYLKEHAVQHFADEEEYMQFIGYSGLKTHKRIHKNFREKILPALEQELMLTDYAPDAVEHFLGVCAGWLIGHTLTEDQAITGRQKSRWGDLLPDDQLSSITTVVNGLVRTMFQLDSQVVSEAYGGERFGKGVYYRLVYSTDQEDKEAEVIMVFEEKLLINTVGKIMGAQSDKLDFVLVNAVRYTAKQFAWYVMKNIPSMGLGELKEENLLTYEQFQEVFEEKKLQISLLMNTTEGYFAYCVIAPHLLKKGARISIRHDNATKVIEKYLTKRDEGPKKKILVVDDSITIRQGMMRMLSGDYEVSEVSSGVSAIRAISLNRPDLVLLDYEMPVCDGRYVLEMLRSEKEFADIPVIFLTSRGDQESVKKVLELKPEGYLLKYLKPSDIKKRIDGFFQKMSDEISG